MLTKIRPLRHAIMLTFVAAILFAVLLIFTYHFMKHFLSWALALMTTACVVVGAEARVPVFEKSDGGKTTRASVTRSVGEQPTTQIPQLRTRPEYGGLMRARKSGMPRHTVIPMKTPAMQAAEALKGIDLRGSVIASSAPKNEFPRGMYRLPGESNGFELLKSGVLANKGGALVDGTYYAVTSLTMFGETIVDVAPYDAETWQPKPYFLEPETSVLASDVTVDPVSGKVYGSFYNDDFDGGYVFGIVDYSTGVRTAICDIPSEIGFYNGVAADADGSIYAVDAHGKFYSVDKTSGAATFIGETGVTPQYTASATIDPVSGRMFWTHSTDETGALYEINKDTGVATLVYEFPGAEEVTGLYVAAPTAQPGAPAAAEDVRVDFAEGSLTGKVCFSVPDHLYDGSAATGNVTYTVATGGETVATGTAVFGTGVEAGVTVKASGDYEFTVTLTNLAGNSPAVKASGYAGYKAPKLTVTGLTYADGKFKLLWEASGVNAGDLTYTVTRYPDAVTVAENISATELDDAVEEPANITVFYYTVQARNHDVVSAVAQSPSVTLGSITPPFVPDFETRNALNGFTVLDNNEDGTTWTHSYFNGFVSLNYNEEYAADDWLITPPLKLEGGKIYKLMYTVSSNDRFAERMEVKMGTAPDAMAMRTVIVPPTEYQTTAEKTEVRYITPDADGKYYIGFHGISDADKYTLYLISMSLSAPMSPLAPDAIGDLTVVPDFNGGLSARVTFTAPIKSIDGTALDAIDRIEVKRGGIRVYTAQNPQPGEAISFSDEVSAAGIYTYSAVAYGTAGEGKNCETKTFIGVNKPSDPTGLVISQSATPGEITLKWDAPATDKDGYPINPGLVRYTIYELGNEDVTVADDVTGTTYTYQALPADSEQEFLQWAVCAKTDAGSSKGLYSDLVPVGRPYALPYCESFANGELTNILGTNNDPYVVWDTTTDSPDVAAQDGDNGYMYMTGYFKDDEAYVFTGRIHLSGEKPGLSFHVFRLTGEDPTVVDSNEIDVYVTADGVKTLVSHIVNSTLPKEADWNRVTIPLDVYGGKDIELTILGRVKNFSNIAIDNIRVDNRRDNNMTVLSISAPETANVCNAFNIAVKVANHGEKTAKGFSVVLDNNGQRVDAREGLTLDPDGTVVVTFEQTLDILSDENNDFTARIVFADDEYADDNISETASVKLLLPELPVVTDLRATENGGVVEVEWTKPDVSASAGARSLADFEEGVAFAHEFAGWTFVDGDNHPVGGFNGIAIPGLTSNETLASFIVFDAAELNHESFAAASGNKFIGALYPTGQVQADDWAISPKLSGNSQTVTLKARSYNSKYPESFEILYSAGSLEPKDFVSVAKHNEISAEWTTYSARLPEGALYFAIRYIATDKLMLMIDDVEYEPALPAHIGHNIYRDGVKLNENTVADTSYTDTEVEAGNHRYDVTAVYDRGESKPATITLLTSGVDDVVASQVHVCVTDRNIVVTGAEGMVVNVCQVDGRTAYSSSSAPARVAVPVSTGVYLVKAGDLTYKVIVR